MCPFPRFFWQSVKCEHKFQFAHIYSLFLCFPSDFMIKVVEVSDSSQQKTLRGHEAPVLSVTFDPKDDFLVGNPSLWWHQADDLWSIWS